MNAITNEQLIERIDSIIPKVKGIISASEWENSELITLVSIVKDALDELPPDVIWLVEDAETAVVKIDISANEEFDNFVETLRSPVAHLAADESIPASEQFQPEADPDVDAADEEAAPEISEPAPAAVADKIPYKKPEVIKADKPKTECVYKGPDLWSDTSEGVAAEDQTKAKHSTTHDLGKWADYQGRALSTSEQNFVIKGMKEEGYSVAIISVVVRLAQQTIYNRLNKMKEQTEGDNNE